MAARSNTTALRTAPVQTPVHSATIIDLAAARRTALLRRLWAEHDGEGRAF